MVGTPQAERGSVLGEDAGQRLALQEHLGHDQVGAGHPGGVGRAPGVGVEHGHDDRMRSRSVRPRSTPTCTAMVCSQVERWL